MMFVSFFNADWAFLGSSLSHMMDRTMPPSEWHQFFALAVVPEGAVHMNAGVEYWQVSGDDHGSTSRALFTEKILSVDGEC